MKTYRTSSERVSRTRRARLLQRAATIEALEPRWLLASIVVNSTADNTANDGVTTLREAITTANSTAASDVITFSLGSGSHTVNLGSALPRLTRPVEIDGPGAALLTVRRSGSANYRIFRTASEVVVSGMTISNARVNDVLGAAGGAVYNEATLVLNDCVISGNTETGGYGGGGVYNDGTLTLNRCVIADNSAVDGGGIMNWGTLTLNLCTVRDNTAAAGGGGLYNVQGTGSAVINQCTFSGNDAVDADTTTANEGGAIYNAGTTSIASCTFAGNTAVSSGGAIHIVGATSITGCTFVDNTTKSFGGAIYQLSQTPLSVANCTFARNVAPAGAAVANGTQATLTGCTLSDNDSLGYGLINPAAVATLDYTGAATTLFNNIIALNGQDGRSDLYGYFLLGDNFVGELLSAAAYDPMLAPLADNGGATQTMALLPGSPCIDAGNNARNASSEDQRGPGFSRVSGPRVDFGAYEAQGVIVDDSGDQSDGDRSAHNLTLREAVEMALADPRFDIIRFADDVFSTPQTIATAGYSITGNLEIRGPGARLLTIRGAGGDTNVFDCDGNVRLTDVTVQNAAQSAAAIDNHDVLALDRVVVSGSGGSGGPGMTNGGTSVVNASTFVDNAGGGIVNLGGSMGVVNSTFTRNTTAIRNQGGALSLSFATISGNTAEGVYNASGTVTANSTLIAQNAGGDVVNADGGTADLAARNFIGTRDGDPMLLPIADNGGSTPTMALRPYSPCINAGGAGGFVATDQRGTSRSRIPDIGAYEFTGPFNNSLVVTTTADEDNGSADPAYGAGTSLREALSYASSTPGTDVITFDLGSTPKVIQIASGELRVTTGITIQGPGANLLTVRGVGRSGYGVFSVSQSPVIASVGPVEISGLTVTNGTSYGIQIVGAYSARVSDCVITGNGQGIYNFAGQLALARCTISGNGPSMNYGGGICSVGTGPVTIDSCTISGNSAAGRGGGLYLALANGTATIRNSTVAGNSTDGEGGGIWFGGTGASLKIDHSTIAGNSALTTGGIVNNVANLILSNTIVAKNTGGDLGTLGAATNAATFSFIGDTQGDPLLGPLADNGGPTRTMAPLAGSPLVDAGDPAFAPPPEFDQRGDGFPRVVGGRVDVGAVEFAPPDETPPTVLDAWFDFNANAVRIRFSEPIDASQILPGAGGLAVIDLAKPAAAVPVGSASYDPQAATVSFPLGALPDGNYRATLRAGGVRDAAGNALAADHAFEFFVLAGDATGDRTVDFNDLVPLAQNYNTVGGMTWANGDFTGDGTVDFDDLVKLAQNYNTSLPGAALAAGPSLSFSGAVAAAFARVAPAVASTPTPSKRTPIMAKPPVRAAAPATPRSKPIMTHVVEAAPEPAPTGKRAVVAPSRARAAEQGTGGWRGLGGGGGVGVGQPNGHVRPQEPGEQLVAAGDAVPPVDQLDVDVDRVRRRGRTSRGALPAAAAGVPLFLWLRGVVGNKLLEAHRYHLERRGVCLGCFQGGAKDRRTT